MPVEDLEAEVVNAARQTAPRAIDVRPPELAPEAPRSFGPRVEPAGAEVVPASEPALAGIGSTESLTVEGTASYHQTTGLWTPNAGGARTMAEARAIAENNGAYIADDVHFIPVEDSLYDSKFGNSYATYGRFTVSDPSAPVMWKASSTTGSGIADSTGRINVWVRQSVLDSDQAITAVLGHETYEIEALRPVFQQNGGALTANNYSNLVRPGVPNNIHWQAVDFGDQLVRDMLGLGGNP
jgi:hypothetical protein